MGLSLISHFGHEVPPSVVHYYAWQALHAIDNDSSTDPFLDNIKSPIHASDNKLMDLEEGFMSLSMYKLHGTVAAGDGIVFAWSCNRMRRCNFLLYTEGILCLRSAGNFCFAFILRFIELIWLHQKWFLWHKVYNAIMIQQTLSIGLWLFSRNMLF